MGLGKGDEQAAQDVRVSPSQTRAFLWWRRVSPHPNKEGLISQLLPESSEAFELYHIIVTTQVNSI